MEDLEHTYQFSNVIPNIQLLRKIKREEDLVADSQGKLSILRPSWRVQIYRKKKVQKAIEYTLISFLYELRAPLDRNKIQQILDKKSRMIQEILLNLEGKKYLEMAHFHEIFRSFLIHSYARLDLLQKVEKATKKGAFFSKRKEIQKALAEGILPHLTVRGLSGVYIMRNSSYEKVGVFKPFDEEIFAPNNPSGIYYKGPIGLRSSRKGIRTGECLHREVAAYYIDQILQLNMVPKTEYAVIAHAYFGGLKRGKTSYTNLNVGLSRALAPLENPKVTKRGSIQEFQEGFKRLSCWKSHDYLKIPLLEVQHLFLLDLIIGHLDRHFSNLLFDGKKIMAIDNGLSFSDIEEGSHAWHWKIFPQCKESLLPTCLHKIKTIPLEKICHHLHKKCYLPIRALELMKARALILQRAALEGRAPLEIIEMMDVTP